MALSNANPKVKPGQLTRAEEKLKRQLDEAKELRQCYAAVLARDGYRCRVCGRACAPNAIDPLNRAERHHLVYRSRGGKHLPENVITVCKARCHDEIHLSGTLKLSGDASLRDEDTGRLCGVRVERLIKDIWQVEKMC